MSKKVFKVADYYIYRSQRESVTDLTNKKLQKLLYYSQAWFYTIRGKKLFPDKIEAWIHGPAILEVYQRYKDFGYNSINVKVKKENFEDLRKEELEILDNVWGVYGILDPDYLEKLTHSERPWIAARMNRAPFENSSEEISLDIMRDYYGEKIKK